VIKKVKAIEDEVEVKVKIIADVMFRVLDLGMDELQVIAREIIEKGLEEMVIDIDDDQGLGQGHMSVEEDDPEPHPDQESIGVTLQGIDRAPVIAKSLRSPLVRHKNRALKQRVPLLLQSTQTPFYFSVLFQY
jgi:hypothetical protein